MMVPKTCALVWNLNLVTLVVASEFLENLWTLLLNSWQSDIKFENSVVALFLLVFYLLMTFRWAHSRAFNAGMLVLPTFHTHILVLIT